MEKRFTPNGRGEIVPAETSESNTGGSPPRAWGDFGTTVVRLKALWKSEHDTWSRRSLAGQRYVYLWADGSHFNIRLEEPDNNRQCILVLMGATADGKKELLAVIDATGNPRNPGRNYCRT